MEAILSHIWYIVATFVAGTLFGWSTVNFYNRIVKPGVEKFFMSKEEK